MARQLTGIVSSDKANKTIVIVVATRKTHPLYKKQYSINTKFMAHDENNEAKMGDLVSIEESRPLSARKRFTLAKIVKKAQFGFEEKDATSDVPQEELVKKQPVAVTSSAKQAPKDDEPAKKSPKVKPEKSAKEKK